MLTIQEIAKSCQAQLFEKENITIKYLSIDSRTIYSVSDTLFVAIVGKHSDGHQYINELHKRGVRNFLVSNFSKTKEIQRDSNILLVDNTLRALQSISTYKRTLYNKPVVGITGSNGKTIVKEWLFQLLNDDYRIIRSPKSYNSQVGVPLSVWNLDSDYDMAIFEAGISQANEMQHIAKIVNPTIGIFTNIGEPHQENFKDYQEKVNEKLKLFLNTKTIIYCKDYQVINESIVNNEIFKSKKIFSWSKKTSASLQITNTESNDSLTNIYASFQGQNFQFSIPFTDEASIENAIHCLAFLLHVKPLQNIDFKRFEQLSTVAMRLELKRGINNCTLINDSYNSDLGSLAIALNFLNHQNQNQLKTLILSDILQANRNEQILYQEVAELLVNHNIRRIIGVGNSISNYFSLFEQNTANQSFTTTDELINAITNKKISFTNEDILIKGSRPFEFERISNLLQLKSHRTILEINLNAITHNFNYFRSLISPKTKMMVMVKALSYGSGTFEIANLLQYLRADYLGVAFADEGVELRKAGITLPIMIMNSDEQNYDVMLEQHLEPEIFTIEMLDEFHKTVLHNQPEHYGYPIHIKVDTGMHRQGFVQEEIPLLIEKLNQYRNLAVRSIFSHLAASDEEKHDSFTISQFQCFEQMSGQIIENYHYPQKRQIIRHILNSTGIQRFPQFQCEMVRLGIGLYGVSPINPEKLAYVGTFKSKVSQIKQIKAGETVGYSRKALISSDSTIAIIPIGYADGLNRRLSNGVGKLLINGQLAPIIGNICMDLCMADITNLNVKVGDEAIVFGEKLPVTEMANTLGTIAYEVFTSVASRVKRVYFQE